MEKLLKAGQRQAPEIMGKDGEKEDALMYRPNPNLLVSKLDQMAEVWFHKLGPLWVSFGSELDMVNSTMWQNM